jgi:hypothetical protein
MILMITNTKSSKMMMITNKVITREEDHTQHSHAHALPPPLLKYTHGDYEHPKQDEENHMGSCITMARP